MNRRVVSPNRRKIILNRRIFRRFTFKRRAHYRRFKYEGIVIEYRIGQTDSFQLSAHTIYTLAIFLNIAIVLKKSSNLRVS